MSPRPDGLLVSIASHQSCEYRNQACSRGRRPDRSLRTREPSTSHTRLKTLTRNNTPPSSTPRKNTRAEQRPRTRAAK